MTDKINLTKMFQEFNNLYSVGHIEKTPENLAKVKSLINDEVRELHAEAFERDFLHPGEVYKEKEIDIKALAFEVTDVIYISLERLCAMGELGNFPEWMVPEEFSINGGDLIISKSSNYDFMDIEHESVLDLVFTLDRHLSKVADNSDCLRGIVRILFIVSDCVDFMSDFGLNAVELLKAKHASNMSKSLSAHNPDLVIKELNHAKNRYPAADAELHGDRYILRCQDTKKVIKPRTYSPATIDDSKLRL
jgi:hypothetical protein